MAGGGGQRLNPAARALALRARLPCMDARRTSARAALTQQDHAAQVESASRPPPPSKPSEGLAGSLSSERRGRPAKRRETGPSEVEWVGRSLSPGLAEAPRRPRREAPETAEARRGARPLLNRRGVKYEIHC